MRLVTVGVGAQNSPRFGPAGLLVAGHGVRVMLDGGPGAEPPGRVDAWLVTDERAELIGRIRRLARDRGLDVRATDLELGDLRLFCRPVVHTNHPTFGYLIVASDPPVRAVWTPEFLEFPKWAAGADVMFAEASGWNRPIRFVGGVGGHLDALSVAREAQRYRIRRLVFAHIGRPTIRAMDAGQHPPFGEFARDGSGVRGGGQATATEPVAVTRLARLTDGFDQAPLAHAGSTRDVLPLGQATT